MIYLYILLKWMHFVLNDLLFICYGTNLANQTSLSQINNQWKWMIITIISLRQLILLTITSGSSNWLKTWDP